MRVSRHYECVLRSQMNKRPVSTENREGSDRKSGHEKAAKVQECERRRRGEIEKVYFFTEQVTRTPRANGLLLFPRD